MAAILNFDFPGTGTGIKVAFNRRRIGNVLHRSIVVDQTGKRRRNIGRKCDKPACVRLRNRRHIDVYRRRFALRRGTAGWVAALIGNVAGSINIKLPAVTRIIHATHRTEFATIMNATGL